MESDIDNDLLWCDRKFPYFDIHTEIYVYTSIYICIESTESLSVRMRSGRKRGQSGLSTPDWVQGLKNKGSIR